MRTLENHKVNGANETLEIHVMDEFGSGGAHHHYLITYPAPESVGGDIGYDVFFQKGPIKEAGVNGITQEALLAICEDRLLCFQSGPYACADNAEALAHIQQAMECLQRRTKARIASGVEGTHTK